MQFVEYIFGYSLKLMSRMPKNWIRITIKTNYIKLFFIIFFYIKFTLW